VACRSTADGYLREADHRPTAAFHWKVVARRTEASLHSGAGSMADVAEAADAIPVGAAAAGSTWEAGWTTGPCCSTTGGFDSARPSSC